MEAKRFIDFFADMNFSAPVKGVFKNSMVEDIRVNKSEKIMKVYISHNKVLEEYIIPKFKENLIENFPFIRKGFKNFVKSRFFYAILKRYTKKINKHLTNLKVVGKENLKNIKGAIITCNHISKCDSFAVRAAAGNNIMYVASELNNWKNIIGVVGRNTGYLPLKQNLDRKVMRKFNDAMEYYLTKKRKKILMYPEQSMWREEPRPRPLKIGAFHYAVKHNVPVIPMFITFKEKEHKYDEQNRVNFADYTIHVLPPIYPNYELENKANAEYMKEENYRLWKELYEKTYNKPLTYNIETKNETK